MERRFRQRVREIETQINEEKRKRKEEGGLKPKHTCGLRRDVTRRQSLQSYCRGNQRSMNRSNALGCALWSEMESTLVIRRQRITRPT